MESRDLKKRLDALPDIAQREVADLVAALEARYRMDRSGPLNALREEPFIGCWSDHDDLADSTTWVRRSRRNDWGPTHG